ncbi:RNA 2'-phosphotransferase [Nostoc ellipsosporum NOK]|nr:RNA 2'-phosphotransferase [Nostoc ellipsosporum NOK]
MEKTLKPLSKQLSYILRHRPDSIGLEIDQAGWADVDTLLQKLKEKGWDVNRIMLDTIVATNEKKRFAYSEDGTRIRASQGHSIEIDLELKEQIPPAVLYHGTAEKNLASIMEQGLLAGNRHHVHLTDNTETARQVGQRHGKPVILRIDAAGMNKDGYIFFCSVNGVWLTDTVPAKYVS